LGETRFSQKPEAVSSYDKKKLEFFETRVLTKLEFQISSYDLISRFGYGITPGCYYQKV
jgi:hypothetical protein